MSGPFVHKCSHPGCDAWGSFGQGVSLMKGRNGTWFCREHLPDAFWDGMRRKEGQAQPPAQPMPADAQAQRPRIGRPAVAKGGQGKLF